MAGATGRSTRPSAPSSTRASPSTTCSTCSRTRRARACTSAIPRATPRPTSSRATSACAASTCCTRWAGTRSACRPSSTPIKTGTHPRDDDRAATSTPSGASSKRSGSRYDWTREVDTTDPELLPLDAVDLPASCSSAGSRTRPRCRSTGARRSAPCSRTRRSSTARASVGGHPGRAPADAAVDAAHHRLRRAAARRPRRRSTGPTARQGDAARLDRPLRGRRGRASRVDGHAGATHRGLHHAARHAVRRDLHGARARAPAGRRRSRRRRSARAVEAYVEARGAQERARRAGRREGRRPASSPARSRSTRSTASAIPIWIADYVLGELRHRRDHGRARRTTSATTSSRRRSACPIVEVVEPRRRDCRRPRRAFIGDGIAVNSRLARRPADAPRRRRAMIALARGARHRRARASTTSCATGCSRASATGASRSRCCICDDGSVDARARVDELPVRAARARRLQADAATASRRSRARTTGSRRPTRATGAPARARDQHDAAVGGLVLVLPALPRPAQRRRRRAIARGRAATGCRSTSTSAAPSTRCCTCSTRASGTRCCSTSGLVHTPEPFQKLVQPGHDPRQELPLLRRRLGRRARRVLLARATCARGRGTVARRHGRELAERVGARRRGALAATGARSRPSIDVELEEVSRRCRRAAATS